MTSQQFSKDHGARDIITKFKRIKPYKAPNQERDVFNQMGSETCSEAQWISTSVS